MSAYLYAAIGLALALAGAVAGAKLASFRRRREVLSDVAAGKQRVDDDLRRNSAEREKLAAGAEAARKEADAAGAAAKVADEDAGLVAKELDDVLRGKKP